MFIHLFVFIISLGNTPWMGTPVHHRAPGAHLSITRGNLAKPVHLLTCFSDMIGSLSTQMNPTMTPRVHAKLHTVIQTSSGSNCEAARSQLAAASLPCCPLYVCLLQSNVAEYYGSESKRKGIWFIVHVFQLNHTFHLFAMREGTSMKVTVKRKG